MSVRPPGRACAARWPWNLPPDDVGRWTTRKPIDAAPRAWFKSTRTLPQRAIPTAFGTIGRLRLPPTPGALIRPRPAPQSDGEAVSGPQQLAEDRGDTAGNLTRTHVDALAHLALDRHAAQAPAPVVQRKPGEGKSPETRAPCRQSRAARNPRIAAAWVPLPRGRTPLWPQSGWTRTDLYRTWRYRASLPMRARPVPSPTRPTGATKDRMPHRRHPLGRGPPPPPAGQRSTSRLSCRPGPRLSADNRIGRLQLTRTMPLTTRWAVYHQGYARWAVYHQGYG
jgi:hypothetical protein